ncbi:MAG: hypothetical protein IRY93_12455, partial [Chthoniobacterales bacterium]|nr:hypothetical protein [Chthoniobacterales bacterium]
LAEGITFVDTPGLGSLAVAGAEETIAYLPRCDLGIVLIDASAGLTQDDLIIVQALYQAGALAMVLISKADLFSAADRQQMTDYVKTNLRAQLGVEPPVHAVSVSGKEAALCDDWFEKQLRPLLSRHVELASAVNKRKIDALREAVVDALDRRLQVGSQIASQHGHALPETAVEALRNGERILERAQGEAFFLTKKIAKMQRVIIDVAAERIAVALMQSNDADVSSIFSETLTQMISERVIATLRSVEQTREILAKAMQNIASCSRNAVPDELPRPTGMPMLDVDEFCRAIQIKKPRLAALFGRTAMAAHVRRKLQQQYDRPVAEFLGLYANRLRRWMEQSIQALRNAFNAYADMYRAQFLPVPAGADLPDKQALQRDLQTLRHWT